MPRVVSFIVLVGILLFIGAMFFKVMAQFVLPLFLAAVLVVVFKPLHMWVREQLPGRLRISALVTTVLIMLIVLIPMAWLGWNAYFEGLEAFSYLRNNRDEVIAKIDAAAEPVADFFGALGGDGTDPDIADPQPDAPVVAAPSPDGVDASAEGGPAEPAVVGADGDAVVRDGAPKPLPSTTKVLYERASGAIGGALLDTAQGLLRILLGLVIMVLALYYFLVDGPSMIHTMMRLSPLENEYERELLDKFANVSRAVVIAVLASAIAQGLLAGAGFYFALRSGAPIFLLTMITMILAVVPFVGAAGVWIPTCLWVYLYQGERVVDGQTVSGDPVAAIGLAVYCACIVSTIDNVIKPYVLHGQSNLHPLLALMSVLGGVTALGPVGILVGPMLVSFIHALLVMVNKELRLLGRGDSLEAIYDKSALALHPGTELEAEAAAGSAARSMLDRLAGAGGAKPQAEPNSPPPQATPDSPGASKEKRRRRRGGR